LREIGSQLDAYDAHVANVMCDKFVSLAINWSEDNAPCHSDGDGQNDEIAEGKAALLSNYSTHHHERSQPTPNMSLDQKLTGAMQEPLGQLLHALLHVDRLRYSLDQYAVRLQDSIRLIIRTCLLEYINSASASDMLVNGNDLSENGDSKSNNDTTPFAQRVRAMVNENFLACLSMCYESLIQTIGRAVAVHIFLHDAFNDEDVLLLGQRKSSFSPRPNQTQSPTVVAAATGDDAQVGAQSKDETEEFLSREKIFVLESSSNLLVNTCDLAQKSVCQLLQMRKDSTGKMTIEQMRFFWEVSLHFVASVEQLQPTNVSLSTQTLRVGLLAHSKRFLEQLHEGYKGKLVNTLDSEKWVQCDVSPERQSSLDRLTKGRSFLPKAKLNGIEHNLPTNGSETPSSIADSEPSAASAKKKKDLTPVLIDGMEYKVVWSALLLCEIILTYLEIAILFPLMTKEVMSKTVDICALFDTRSRQLVLGAQAIQSAARLQSIAAKHLAIMAQCLSFFRAVFPHLRVALLAQLPGEQHSSSMIEIDRVSQNMTDHHSKVLSKFVSIVGDFVDSSAVKLRQIDWDRFSGNCDYFEEVSRNVTAMHRVLQSYLPPDQMKDVFTRIFILLNSKIPSHFDETLPSTQTGRQRIVDEISHLASNLSRLKFTDSSSLTIEETFRKKFER
jgi:vacuolar protein sorting-associated protein 54